MDLGRRGEFEKGGDSSGRSLDLVERQSRQMGNQTTEAVNRQSLLIAFGGSFVVR